jgi:hypothetical protein
LDRLQICPVVDAKVVEWTEEVLLKRFPQPQFCCDSATEELTYIDAIGTLGCRGQPD